MEKNPAHMLKLYYLINNRRGYGKIYLYWFDLCSDKVDTAALILSRCYDSLLFT